MLPLATERCLNELGNLGQGNLSNLTQQRLGFIRPKSTRGRSRRKEGRRAEGSCSWLMEGLDVETGSKARCKKREGRKTEEKRSEPD